jgi:hypothetical protein
VIIVSLDSLICLLRPSFYIIKNIGHMPKISPSPPPPFSPFSPSTFQILTKYYFCAQLLYSHITYFTSFLLIHFTKLLILQLLLYLVIFHKCGFSKSPRYNFSYHFTPQLNNTLFYDIIHHVPISFLILIFFPLFSLAHLPMTHGSKMDLSLGDT